jgi:retron-type reverse transcriptase
MKDFSPTCCRWIASFMEGGHVDVKINDQIQNFQTKKEVRQGDLLSPILFNIVVDMLEILIKRAKEEGQIIGVIPHLVMMGSRYLNMRTIRFYLWNTI